MSVPEPNAFPPAPRRTIPRTDASRSTRSHAATSAAYISHVIAFRASGRLNVSVARGPSMSNVVCVVDKRSSLKYKRWRDSWRARRTPRARRDAGDGGSILLDAPRRPRRGRHQDRAAVGRFHAFDAGRRRYRQPELQRRQSRQAQRRAEPQDAGWTRRARAPHAVGRYFRRELSAGRARVARPRLPVAREGEPAPHLRVDIRIRTNRARRAQR